jgi:hypothetical protein
VKKKMTVSVSSGFGAWPEALECAAGRRFEGRRNLKECSPGSPVTPAWNSRTAGITPGGALLIPSRIPSESGAKPRHSKAFGRPAQSSMYLRVTSHSTPITVLLSLQQVPMRESSAWSKTLRAVESGVALKRLPPHSKKPRSVLRF